MECMPRNAPRWPGAFPGASPGTDERRNTKDKVWNSGAEESHVGATWSSYLSPRIREPNAIFPFLVRRRFSAFPAFPGRPLTRGSSTWRGSRPMDLLAAGSSSDVRTSREIWNLAKRITNIFACCMKRFMRRFIACRGISLMNSCKNRTDLRGEIQDSNGDNLYASFGGSWFVKRGHKLLSLKCSAICNDWCWGTVLWNARHVQKFQCSLYKGFT